MEMDRALCPSLFTSGPCAPPGPTHPGARCQLALFMAAHTLAAPPAKVRFPPYSQELRPHGSLLLSPLLDPTFLHSWQKGHHCTVGRQRQAGDQATLSQPQACGPQPRCPSVSISLPCVSVLFPHLPLKQFDQISGSQLGPHIQIRWGPS